MQKRALTFVFAVLYCLSFYAGDSIKSKFPHFIAVNASDGLVFPTNKFVSGEDRIPHYTALSLKYGISSKGDNWKDYAYGLPTSALDYIWLISNGDKTWVLPFRSFSFRGLPFHNSNRG